MSLKSLGKIAAIGAVAGLTLTACADDAASQARDQEETCGLVMGAETKANEGIQQAGMAMQQGEGQGDRAGQALESAAMDIRNHSFDRSDDQQNPDTGESIPLQTSLQVHAAYFEEMSAAMDGGLEAMQGFDPTTFEAEGMNLTEALENINGYCASYAQQEMQQQMPEQQMPQQEMPEEIPEEELPDELTPDEDGES